MQNIPNAPRKLSCVPFQSYSLLQGQPLFCLLGLPMSFARSWTSSKWNHTACTLLCPDFFLKTQSFGDWSTLWYVTVVHSFYCCAVFQHINKPESNQPLSCPWPYGWFPVWAILNNAGMHIRLHALWGTQALLSPRHIPRHGISGHRVNVLSASVETNKLFSKRLHPLLHAHEQCLRFWSLRIFTKSW